MFTKIYCVSVSLMNIGAAGDVLYLYLGTQTQRIFKFL